MQAVDVAIRKRRSDAKYPNRTAQQNASRTLKRATGPRTFIGVDGEGVTNDDGTHDYVLLSVGSDSLHRSGARLSFEDVAVFLWDSRLRYGPDAIFVGFYLSYDFTMWFRDLPESRARMMLTDEGAKKRVRKMGKNPVPFPVYYEGWEMDMHAGKRFKLRPRGSSDSWLYVCDAGPFFQTSFLKAIDPKSWPVPILSGEEYERIREGKSQRSSAVFDSGMVRYNTLENDVLARVMSSLDDGFTTMGVRLRKTQWYGPGQAAQQWLNNIQAPTRDEIEATTPPDVLSAAQASYYGGWFEITCHGLITDTTWEYDINSAYPAIIAALPCLLHGRWANQPGEITLVNATLRGSNEYFGVGPHRSREGVISRPQCTRGWFWQHEIDAATRAGCIDHVEVHRIFGFSRECHHSPFAEIAELYRQRQAVGKDSPLGKALKLVYNSAYGKEAQSIGEPKYANPIAASLITAGCRAMIWDAIATHPEGPSAVTMVATDGVFFRFPHPTLRLSDTLGDWDITTHENLTQFMPGVYWDDRTREQTEGDERNYAKTRGISASDLRGVVKRLDSDFSGYRAVCRGGLDLSRLGSTLGMNDDQIREFAKTWPHVSVPISFGLVSAKLALHRNDWSSAGSISRKPRLISADPSDKRDPASTYVDASGVIRTRPYKRREDITSTAYDKSFGLKLREMVLEDDVVTPTGRVMDELYEYIQGE